MTRVTFISGLRLSSVISVALFSGAGAAWAQADRANNTSSRPAVQNDEIIVTAQKRAQTLTDVAASISAFSRSTIEDRGLNNFESLQQQVPSVSLGVSTGTTQISIRGVGWTINTGAGEPGVAVHLDGVYEPRPVLADIAQFDLERVEILRGPQGTLYGRNATGGTINFISSAPTRKLGGYAKFGYASYDEVHSEAVLSGPLSDNVRARVGVTYTYRGDPFIKNIQPGQNGFGVRKNFGAKGRVDVDFSDRFTGEFAGLYVRENSNVGGFVARDPMSEAQLAVNPAFQTALFAFGPRVTAGDEPVTNRKAAQGRATLNYELSDSLSLKSITGHTYIDNLVDVDADQSGAPAGFIVNAFKSKATSEELNLSGNFDKLSFVLGGFYFHENLRGRQNVLFGTDVFLGIPLGGGAYLPIQIFSDGDELIQNYQEKRNSYAGFVDATYRLTEKLSVNLGARYSVDKTKLNQTQGLLGALACNGLVTDAKFEAFTPAATLKFEPTSQSNIYAKVSKGYKSGGINFGTCGDVYDPEKITAYEVGAKAQLFQNVLGFSLSAFHYDYKDLQVYQLVPLAQGGGSFVDNAPRARIRGVEGDVTLNLLPGLTLNAGGAYMDAKFLEYSNIDSSDLTGTVQNLRGNRIARSPKFTGNAGIQYTSPEIAGVGTITIRGDVYHSSSQFYTEFNLPSDRQSGYEVYNAFIKLATLDDRFDIRFYGKNLSDKRYFTFLTRSSLIGSTAVNYASPRQFGFEATTRF